MTFINLDKAYNSVEWNGQNRIWQEYNMDNCFIGIIKELYAINRTYTKQGNKLFPIYPSKSLLWIISAIAQHLSEKSAKEMMEELW